MFEAATTFVGQGNWFEDEMRRGVVEAEGLVKLDEEIDSEVNWVRQHR